MHCDAMTSIADACTTWVAREEVRGSEASRATWPRVPDRPTRIDRLATALRALAHEDQRRTLAGKSR